MSKQLDKIRDQMLRDLEKPTPEALYQKLGRVRAEMPHWDDLHKPETSPWLGRALALVEEAGTAIDIATLRTSVKFLHQPNQYSNHAQEIAVCIDTVLAKLELKLPADAQGAFIPAGGAFDAFQAVSKAVGSAKCDVLFVDPYADDTLVADFAPLVPENVQVLILSDAAIGIVAEAASTRAPLGASTITAGSPSLGRGQRTATSCGGAMSA